MSNDRLWAPWRIGYILGDDALPKPAPLDRLQPGADAACFLCQCAIDGDDRARMVVERTEHTVTVLNRYPYNNGHLLVAPCWHLGRLDELGDQLQLELARTLTRMVALLEKTIKPQGLNIGLNLGRVAGAGLPGHFHWHIVPRWDGDTNFMLTTAATRVIPQSLDALWELLTGARSEG